jgi:hypothetical protein
LRARTSSCSATAAGWARTDDQYARLDRWRAGGRNLVVVELGAGTDVPSVRRVCEAQDALVALKKLLD